MSQRVILKMIAMSLGAACMGIQILLLRQFMSVFYGNELIIGVMLSLWLLWVGLGSAIGHRWWKTRLPKMSTFSLLFLIKLIATAIVYSACKYVRLLFGVSYGEYLTFSQIILFAALALFLPALLAGFLFSTLARLHNVLLAEDESAAFVYAFEAVGTVLSGLLFTFLPANGAGLTSLFLLGFIVFTLVFFTTRRFPFFVPAVLFLSLLIPPLPHKIETILLQHYWRSMNASFDLVDWRFTRFGQASVIEWGGDKVLYFNGTKVASLQNAMDNQALAATLLVQHPRPTRILIIEGNSSSLAIECAKFNVQVDVMELDRRLFEFAAKHMDADTRRAWDDEKINLLFVDGRRALKRRDHVWDMIIVNVGTPATALANRYYTTAFFQRARASLAPDGVLALCHFPAGENYLGRELLSLNKILHNTLRAEFNRVLALPGDYATYFASNTLPLETTTAELERRYQWRDPSFHYFSPAMLRYIYDSYRIDNFSTTVQTAAETRQNHDFKPVSYIFDFLIWHKIGRGHESLLRSLVAVKRLPLYLGFGILTFLGLFSLIFVKNRRTSMWAVRLVTAITGFVGMTYTVILLLSFQTLFGYVYTWVGLAMAAYMAGTAAASLWIQKTSPRAKTVRTLLGLLLLKMMTVLLLIPILELANAINSPMIYIALFAGAGGMVGAAFPLLCRLYSHISGEEELGSIYAADVTGGAVGAFVISSLLAPLYGFFDTLLLTSALCLVGFVIVFARGQWRFFTARR